MIKVSGGGAFSKIEPKWGGGAYAKGGAYAGEYGSKLLSSCQRCRFAELDENVSSRALFWTAPEHLQKHFLAPTEHSDVYRYNNDLFTQSCG